MAELYLHSATKHFGTKKVLTTVRFNLKTATVMSIFGRNGSGKSTLLKILFGTLKADTLVLKIDGKQVNPRHNMVNQHISYLPQHPFLPKRLRVRDIVPIMHPGEEQQDAIFYDPHIAAIATKNVWELSLGESKYLGVTLLGHLPHPFMLLDEPFSMLEPQLVHTMKQFLNKVKKRKGIIITDHYYRDVLDIADTNFVIKDGISHSVETENELKEFDYLKKSNN